MKTTLGRILLSCLCFVQIGVNAQVTQSYCLPPPNVRNQALVSPSPNLPNGRYSVGTELTITCRAGYTLVGTNPVTCSNGRYWSINRSQGSPRCVAITTPTNQPSTNNPVICNGGCPVLNTICQMFRGRPRCLCRPGYFEFGRSCQLRSIAVPSPGQCTAPCPVNSDCVTVNNNPGCLCRVGYVVYNRRSCVPRPTGSVVTLPSSTVSGVTCSRPAESPNRITLPDRTKQVWTVGERIIYACENGQIINGVRRSVCDGNGQFQSAPPTCQNPSPTVTARVTGATSTAPPQVNCFYPVAPTNGYTAPIGKTSFVYNEQVQFGCDTGYTLSGTSVATCQSNGQFSAYSNLCAAIPAASPRPTGINVPCAIPVAPLNGRIIPADRSVWISGNVVTFVCEPGFTLVGSGVATCRGDGTFSDFPPRCEGSVRCDPPLIPFRGTIDKIQQTVWVPGQVATYSCNPGYILLGGPTITCQNDGTYSDIFPSCTVIQPQTTTTASPVVCTNPTVPLNGYAQPRGKTVWTSGETVYFDCDGNRLLVGDRSTECGGDGLFTPATSFCVEQRPQPIATTTTSPPTQSSTNPPTTSSICPRPANPANGRVLGVRSSFSPNDLVQFSCDSGFEIITGSPFLLCLPGGNYNFLPPTCGRSVTVPAGTTCPRPSDPVDGEVLDTTGKQSWQVGEALLYNCFAGFNLVGSENVQCTQSGDFSDVAPDCVAVTPPAVTCSDPAAPVNGYILNPQLSWVENDVVFHECNDGFQLNGQDQATCTATGQFSNPPPTCTAVTPPARLTCSDPAVPVNGYILNPQLSWVENDVVFYECNDGLQLNGQDQATCTATGQFSNPPPTCTAPVTATCTAPVSASGSVTGGVTAGPKHDRTVTASVGETIRFACDSTYSIVGASAITCQADGTFDDLPAECTACTPIPPLNGRLLPVGRRSWNFTDLINYGCEPGFIPSGISTAFCNFEGEILGGPPTCNPENPTSAARVCNTTAPENGSIIPDVIVTGEIFEYSCNAGYTLTGFDRNVCLADGKLAVAPPSCTCMFIYLL